MKTYQLGTAGDRIVTVKKSQGQLVVTVKVKDAENKFINLPPKRQVLKVTFYIFVYLNSAFSLPSNMMFIVDKPIVFHMLQMGCISSSRRRHQQECEGFVGRWSEREISSPYRRGLLRQRDLGLSVCRLQKMVSTVRRERSRRHKADQSRSCPTTERVDISLLPHRHNQRLPLNSRDCVAMLF